MRATFSFLHSSVYLFILLTKSRHYDLSPGFSGFLSCKFVAWKAVLLGCLWDEVYQKISLRVILLCSLVINLWVTPLRKIMSGFLLLLYLVLSFSPISFPFLTSYLSPSLCPLFSESQFSFYIFSFWGKCFLHSKSK